MNGHAVYASVQKQKHDTPSIAEQVEEYAPLVKRIAYHTVGRLPASVQVDDLIQAGMVGLLEAIQKFDVSMGTKFESFAGMRIRGAMIDEIRKGDWTPRSVHRKSREVAGAIRSVEKRLGREAKDQEIADEMEISLDDYYHIVQDSVGCQVFSIDSSESLDLTEDRMVDKGTGPFDNIKNLNFRKALVKTIGELPEREKLVMSLYYDEELNLREIAAVLGVSESRVSQIHSQAILRVKSRMSEWTS
jgi:RNA polymerase sigma factor FliA